MAGRSVVTMRTFSVRTWLARQLGIPPETLVLAGEVVTPEGAREIRYLRSGQYVISVLVTGGASPGLGWHVEAMWPDGRAMADVPSDQRLSP